MMKCFIIIVVDWLTIIIQFILLKQIYVSFEKIIYHFPVHLIWYSIIIFVSICVCVCVYVINVE
jgi:hypothetical protein